MSERPTGTLTTGKRYTRAVCVGNAAVIVEADDIAELNRISHIVALAPDLLEACEALLYAYPEMNYTAAESALDMASAAIAKATGTA